MPDNFFDYLNGENKPEKPKTTEQKPIPESKEEVLSTVAQDESIVGPWETKLIIYCEKGAKDLVEELRSRNGVLAVFVHKRENAPAVDKKTPPLNK